MTINSLGLIPFRQNDLLTCTKRRYRWGLEGGRTNERCLFKLHLFRRLGDLQSKIHTGRSSTNHHHPFVCENVRSPIIMAVDLLPLELVYPVHKRDHRRVVVTKNEEKNESRKCISQFNFNLLAFEQRERRNLYVIKFII